MLSLGIWRNLDAHHNGPGTLLLGAIAGRFIREVPKRIRIHGWLTLLLFLAIPMIDSALSVSVRIAGALERFFDTRLSSPVFIGITMLDYILLALAVMILPRIYFVSRWQVAANAES